LLQSGTIETVLLHNRQTIHYQPLGPTAYSQTSEVFKESTYTDC